MRGCKIAVDGYCFGQRLSTAIFHFNSYKIIENQRENQAYLKSLPSGILKNPSFLNPSFPESSTSPCVAGSLTLFVQNAVWRKRKKKGEEEERREEEDRRGRV